MRNKTKIILCISCLALSFGNTNAQSLKNLGKPFLKGYIEGQNNQNNKTRESAERYEAEQRESYQRLKEQGFDIDPNKMAEKDKKEKYGERLDKADAWDSSTTQEQQAKVIEESLNRIGKKIDNKIVKRRSKKSEEQIAQWERAENWCALQCHTVNEETGDIEYNFECEVKCNQEQRAEEARIRWEEAEENRRAKEVQSQSSQIGDNNTGVYAYIDTQEIFKLMPETIEMQRKLAQRQEQITAELSSIENQYNSLLNEYQNYHKNWSENVLSTKQKELQSIAESYEKYRQNSTENIQIMQNELVKPIEEKIKNAIQTVGFENDFLFIFDVSALLYVNGIDANRLVKQKLGI